MKIYTDLQFIKRYKKEFRFRASQLLSDIRFVDCVYFYYHKLFGCFYVCHKISRAKAANGFKFLGCYVFKVSK